MCVMWQRPGGFPFPTWIPAGMRDTGWRRSAPSASGAAGAGPGALRSTSLPARESSCVPPPGAREGWWRESARAGARAREIEVRGGGRGEAKAEPVASGGLEGERL